MASLDSKVFFQLLREAPERRFLSETPEYSEYLQREVFDRLSRGEEVDLSKLDWDAFSLYHVTPEWYPGLFERAEERLIKGMCRLLHKIAPAIQTEQKFF